MPNMTPRPNVRLEELCDQTAIRHGRTDANAADVREARRTLQREQQNISAKLPIGTQKYVKRHA
jgi:hypothetical protein